jgi:2-keto-4-pentenoate hydratase/2-oxohepta-3-ene-1,7-dioic acid hydratase in catechol pathway
MAEGAAAVRVFAVRAGAGAPGGLLLELDGRGWDLSARLRSEGAEPDVVALAAAGRLAPERLREEVAGGTWSEVDPPSEAAAAGLVLDLPLPRRRIGKILALGKNFRAHALELGGEVPEEPFFFAKLPENLVPHEATVSVPAWYQGRVDHEAELAVVIGGEGRDLAPEAAAELVAGYTVANDLTARTLQQSDRERGHPWLRAKNLEGFCPLGPCFVPRAALDVSDLRVSARVNGELRQDARTRDWITGIPDALAFVSRHVRLHPGDLLLTGTPAGVGPLADGDRVVCAVEGIGELATRIARPG